MIGTYYGVQKNNYCMIPGIVLWYAYRTCTNTDNDGRIENKKEFVQDLGNMMTQ